MPTKFFLEFDCNKARLALGVGKPRNQFNLALEKSKVNRE